MNIKQGGKIVRAKKCTRCRGRGRSFARCGWYCPVSIGRKAPGWCEHVCGPCDGRGRVPR